MNRNWTNRIRFVMDELLPPIIRDNRFFMWFFYVLAYRCFAPRKFMDFKLHAYEMDQNGYSEFYKSLNTSVSRLRESDLNTQCINFIDDFISLNHSLLKNVLDVGSGNGYLLKKIKNTNPGLQLTSVDAKTFLDPNLPYTSVFGLLPKLPFESRSFDLVICTHVLEHVLDLQDSVDELLRLANRFVLVVVPRQRYYRYTLDEHLQFFPHANDLVRMFGRERTQVSLLGGDWLILVGCA